MGDRAIAKQAAEIRRLRAALNVIAKQAEERANYEDDFLVDEIVKLAREALKRA